MVKIRQELPSQAVDDLECRILHQISPLISCLKPCSSIALAVGSRGIPQIARVVNVLVKYLVDNGHRPFIVPAMGSHGGATAEGQTEILRGYGISEEQVGAPVRSSMEVVRLDGRDKEFAVYMDKLAYESDGVILVNRIKPHTDFHGMYESGLVKMSVVGLGKHAAALEIHRFGVFGLKQLLPQMAGIVLASGKIIGGVALLENAVGGLADVVAMQTHEILSKEPVLLERARLLMPSLPLEEADVLIVDALGKDISGTGMDPNIIGRIRIRGEEEPVSPVLKSIVVTDLSDASHGNALGIGLADVITRRLYEKISFADMYENAFTSTFLERVKVPLVAPNDREALKYAVRSCGGKSVSDLKVMRIRDTLHLQDAYLSLNALNEYEKKAGKVEILKRNETLFSEEGNLLPF